MKLKSTYTPVIVPATFEDWKKKHFFNPESKPISYSRFTKRGKAPKLYLKYYNHKFNIPEKPINPLLQFALDLMEIPSNIKLECKRHILFASWA